MLMGHSKGRTEMKRRVWIWIAVLAMGMGSTLLADNEWGVFGSYWAPSDGDTALGAGIKVGIEMVERAQLDLRYSYMSHVIDKDGASLDVQPLEGGLSFSFPVREGLKPYVGLGLGYYLMDGKVKGFDTDPDHEVGWFANAGLTWTLSRSGADLGETLTKLFVEAMYRQVEVDNMKLHGTPARLDDADLGGFSFQAGLLIGW